MSDAASKTPKMRRGVRILLFASLALNLLVVGLVFGAFVSHRYEDRRGPPRMEQVGGPLAAALSRQDRRKVGREMRRIYRAERASQDDIGAGFSEVITALTMVPYDSVAARMAVERQVHTITRRVDLGVDILLKRFDEMSDSERAAYTERLKEVLKRGPRRPPKN
jgi:uncharacterized membrane protein